MKIKPALKPIIDGDILVYRLGFAADAQAKREAPESWETQDYLSWALHLVDNQIKAITETAFGEATQYWLFLSGKDNFRKEVATIKEYKGNRKDAKKPKYYEELREYMTEVWGASIVDGIEADDAIGQLQFSHNDKSTVICSIDKDLNMIPGYHFNFVKGEFYDVKLAEANLTFLRQMLTGDSTDNIPGIRGIGPKTVDKLIPKGCEETKAIETINSCYKKQYGEGWEAAAEEVAKLLWIRRIDQTDCPYIQNFKAEVMNGQVSLEEST